MLWECVSRLGHRYTRGGWGEGNHRPGQEQNQWHALVISATVTRVVVTFRLGAAWCQSLHTKDESKQSTQAVDEATPRSTVGGALVVRPLRRTGAAACRPGAGGGWEGGAKLTSIMAAKPTAAIAAHRPIVGAIRTTACPSQVWTVAAATLQRDVYE